MDNVSSCCLIMDFLILHLLMLNVYHFLAFYVPFLYLYNSHSNPSYTFHVPSLWPKLD